MCSTVDGCNNSRLNRSGEKGRRKNKIHQEASLCFSESEWLFLTPILLKEFALVCSLPNLCEIVGKDILFL